MALSKMKLVNIIGKMNDLDDVANILGDTGVFQPDDAADYFSENSEIMPVSIGNEAAPALERIRIVLAETGIKPDIVPPGEYEQKSAEELFYFVDELDRDIGEMIRERNQITEEMKRIEAVIESTEHFIGLDIDITKLRDCRYIKTVFGSLPKESYKKLLAYSDDPYVEFFPCTTDKTRYWGVYVTPLSEADKVDRIFSRLYFEGYSVDEIDGTPAAYIEQQQQKYMELSERYKTLDSKIKSFGEENKEKVLQLFSALCELHAYAAIKSHACTFRHSFILVGWIPSEYEGFIQKSLSEIESLEVTFTDAKDELKHSPPVKLKNRFFAKPFEYYTEMYGLPNYCEIDPSGFIALTYTLLFGIMFADVGQGILLLFAAIYMYRVKKMPLGRLLIPCSICSTIFGMIFGSVFGFESLLNPMYKALFGLKEKPVDVMESDTTMLLIFGAVGIGVVLLLIAMMLNIISSFKRGDVGNALFGVNGFAGMTFYASLVAGLFCNIVLGVNIMTTTYILLLIILPITLVFLREPLSKLIKGESNIFGGSIGSFIVDNIFELFEVALSYVTNTMSFLRVGAFILVHAGMMQVVFVLAGMFGTVGYTITVIIGNLIVMALEALLVGIQVLRLEYYEMFSRFFIGDGRKFTPIKIDNKV